MTSQEKVESALARLSHGCDALLRAIGTDKASPTDEQVDGLVSAIDACTTSAEELKGE